jgi:hypothetical protein
VRAAAQRFAEGRAEDRAASLELDAAGLAAPAIEALGRGAVDSVDASLRDGWERATLRATTWEPVGDAPQTWVVTGRDDGQAPACRGAAPGGDSPPERASSPAGPREIVDRVTEIAAVPWQGAFVVRLLAVAPCSAKPIQIEVDGQALSAQPSGERAAWQVVVRGPTAHVRRVDRGEGHVYAAGDDDECRETSNLRAPSPLDETRAIAYPAGVLAPGVEVWLRQGAGRKTVELRSLDGKDSAELAVRASAGLTARDERGGTWVRAARVPLPPWARHGLRALRADGVALRAVARAVRAEAAAPDGAPARTPDVGELVRVSREILGREPTQRAGGYVQRALLLASYGATKAALEDAAAAQQLGAKGPGGDDVVAEVRRSLHRAAPTKIELAQAAYGLEPDFDPDAVRCAPGRDGPRARIAALEAGLRVRARGGPFDPAMAVRAAQAAVDAAGDPRAESLLHLAMPSSRWQLVKNVEGGAGRVPRPIETAERDPVIDGEGRLRPRILAGDPFGSSFVIVSADRPARASLADLGAAKVRLDAACVARRPHERSAPCPLRYRIGDGAPAEIPVGRDGRGSVALAPAGGGKAARLQVELSPSGADYVALVRAVVDRKVPGAVMVPDVGWVLDTPHVQHRSLVVPSRPVRIEVKAPAVVRVDARTEGGTPEIVAVADGREIPVPPDGSPHVIPVARGDEVVVKARSGQATVALAERLQEEPRAETVLEAPPVIPAAKRDVSAATVELSGGPTRGWEAVAESSPRPLTWLEDHLGTIESDSGYAINTFTDGATAAAEQDTFAYENLAYRRRIEAPNLYTILTASARLRQSENSYATSAGLYEDWDALRLRISATASVATQVIGGHREATFEPRGFIEYSGRVAPNFFVLPRLGYDGSYTTLQRRPGSERDVDDDVYDAFRFTRSTFAFLQGLFWFAPHFNDIFYLRLRGTYDVGNGQFSHASARPGTFLIFGPVETAAFVDTQYYAPTPGVRTSGGVDVTGGAGLLFHIVLAPGSFELRPGTTATYRATDGAWQVSAGLGIVASFRRGMRDYSSLELEFPEETSGGIPWRTESRTGP